MGWALKETMAKMIGKTARVQRVEETSATLRRLELEGESLRGIGLRAGDKIKAHVGDGQMRSYTPCAFDPANGRMDVLVHAHGDSAGSDWARDGNGKGIDQAGSAERHRALLARDRAFLPA